MESYRYSDCVTAIQSPHGRRERKKAATRKAISNAATLLFLERGFDNVSIREVAEKADVSPTTVFAHFPQKEALVFDEDEEQRDLLIAAVRERPRGRSITRALHLYLADGIAESRTEHGDYQTRVFMEFVDRNPALSDYAARMWVRYEDALAAVIAEELRLPKPSHEIRAYARFVLQAQIIATSNRDPLGMLDAAFRVLEHGWAAVVSPPEAERRRRPAPRMHRMRDGG